MMLSQTIEARIGTEVELKTTASGKQFCSFRCVYNRNRFNEQTKQWEQLTSTWVAVTAWGKLAEHAAESLKKGDDVLVYGQLEQREYIDRNNNPGYSLDMQAQVIGLSLSRNNAHSAPAQQAGSYPQQNGQTSADTWGGAPQKNSFAAGTVEPPF